MRFVITISAVIFAWTCTALASEQAFRDAYAAYQEAAATGDLHAALPHAERTYELGLEMFGPESRNTGLLAFNYGSALNESLDFEGAAPVLQQSVDALTASGATDLSSMHNARLELAKAYLGQNEIPDAQAILDDLIDYDADHFGPDSFEFAETQFYEAMLPLFGNLGEGSRVFVSSGRYVYQLTRSEAERLDRPGRSRHAPDFDDTADETEQVIHSAMGRAELARTTFASLSGREIDVAKADLVLAGLILLSGDRNGADTQYAESLDALIDLGYADHFSTHIAADWVTGINRYEWSAEELADHINQVATFAGFRREGHPHILARTAPQYPIAALNNDIEAMVCASFTVSAAGRVEDSEVYTTAHPSMFNRSAIEALERFIYLPQVRNGHAVDHEGQRNCFNFTLDG